MTDAELIGRIQAGDEEVLAELVSKYQKKLVHFCLRYVHDEQDAQDAAEEAFIKVYKNIAKVDVTRKFSTYLFEIAKHEAINIWRRKHRQVPLPENLVAEPLPEIADYSFVHRALSNLEAKYRQVIKLYYFDNISYKNIASTLSIPINTVRTYLFRAKARLKQMLKRN